VINPVKKLRQINVHRNATAFLDYTLNLLNRLLPITPRTEPESVA